MKWILLGSLLVLVGTSQGQEEFSFDDAITYGLENHNSIKDSYLELADATSNIKEYWAIGLPQVTADLGFTHYLTLPTSIIPAGSFFEGDPDQGIAPNPPEDLAVQFGTTNNINAGLNLDALLFDGSFFVGLQAAKMIKELRQRQIDITKEEIAGNVAKSYLAVLVADQNIGIINKNITNLQTTLNETQQIYENGFAEKLDVDRLTLSLSNLQNERDKLLGIRELTKNVLKFQMGYPLDQDIQLKQTLDDVLLPEQEIESSLSEQLQLENRAEYVALLAGKNLSEINIKQLKMQYLPSLRANAGYAQQLQANSLSDASWFPVAYIGASLSVPIFDGRDKSAKIDRARIALDKQNIAIEDFGRAVTLQTENAKIDFINANKTVTNTEESLDLAEHIYETTQIKYREGVGSSVELTQAERELYSAQSNYSNALYDLLVAKVNLDIALGTLINE